MADEYEDEDESVVDDTVSDEGSSQDTISVDSMIDRIIDGDNTRAKEEFEALISAKLNSALDARKREIASALYSDDEQEENSETQED